MTDNFSTALTGYTQDPFGELRLERVRIGRVEFEGISITGREAAINLHELFQTACDKTRRLRISKNGTRYPEPLPTGTPARLLSSEIKDYLRDMERRNLRRRTIEATSRTLEILQLACGDIPVSRIDHKHIYALWDLLRWSPKNLTTAPENRSLNAEALIAKGKGEVVATPAVATFELHRRFLSTFFGALVKARAIPYSPMDAFGEMKKDLIEDDERPDRLFTDDDLRRVFDPAIFIPWARKFPHRWWAPMIGLYTGARVNEVAQLKANDVLQDHGTWCFAFRKTVDEDLAGRTTGRSRQTLKGKSSVRRVPIAQALLDVGFLEFVDDIRACGHPRLFPNLSAGVNRKNGESNERYSAALIHQFSVYLKKLGFGKGVGFHAFRHTLATELEHKGVRIEDIALITGHSVAKKVPVLQDSYVHKLQDRIRAKQLVVLPQYQPPVQLPIYKKGQFRDRLGKGAKLYP
jgi:integrase